MLMISSVYTESLTEKDDQDCIILYCLVKFKNENSSSDTAYKGHDFNNIKFVHDLFFRNQI